MEMLVQTLIYMCHVSMEIRLTLRHSLWVRSVCVNLSTCQSGHGMVRANKKRHVWDQYKLGILLLASRLLFHCNSARKHWGCTHEARCHTSPIRATRNQCVQRGGGVNFLRPPNDFQYWASLTCLHCFCLPPAAFVKQPQRSAWLN